MLPRCQLVAVQGALHAEHLDACASQGKGAICGLLKGVWPMTNLKIAKQRAQELADLYRAKCPKAVETSEAGLEDALTFLLFPPAIPFIGCPEGQFQQRAGAAEQGVTATHKGGRHPP